MKHGRQSGSVKKYSFGLNQTDSFHLACSLKLCCITGEPDRRIHTTCWKNAVLKPHSHVCKHAFTLHHLHWEMDHSVNSCLLLSTCRPLQPAAEQSTIYNNLLGILSQFIFTKRQNPKGSTSKDRRGCISQQLMESLHSTVTLSLQTTPFVCNRFPSEEVAVSIDLYITSTLTLQLMSKITVLGITQACSEVQRTQMEKEKQKC